MNGRFWARVRVLSALALLVGVAGIRCCPTALLLRLGRVDQEHPVRRPVYVRARPLHDGARGLLGRGLPAWVHGYPLAEQNLMQIMKECRCSTCTSRRSTSWPSTIRSSRGIRGVHHRGGLVVAEA